MEVEQKPPEPKPARAERPERVEKGETPTAPTSRRRTAAAGTTTAAAAAAAPVESREPATPPEPPRDVIRFATDNRLNVAYNPNCTHEASARESFVADVLGKSEAGARAVCPRCDQQAMRFVRVNTALGLFGIGACERCGYWYLM